MSTEPLTDVKHEVVVDVPQARAFEAFMDLDRIKPREHNLLSVPLEETVVERRVGGDIYDRGTDGSRCRWARVLAYDPPSRFVFSWDIGPDWRLQEDLERTSEVEVTFTPEGDDRTRVSLVHRHLERHGVGWEAARDGVASEDGWPLYLQRYVELLAETAA